MLEKRAVVALVDEEACFLTIEPVGMKLESVFEGDGFGFVANEVAIDWFDWGFEWHGAFGFVVDILHGRDDFDEEFGNDILSVVHAYGVGLNDGCVAIDVDDKAWEIVALAMHEAVGVGVVGLGKTERDAHVVGCLEAFVPEGAVDRAVGEREYAHHDATYLVVANGKELLVGTDDAHEVAFFGFACYFGDCTRENPWVKSEYVFFAFWFELDCNHICFFRQNDIRT